MSLFLSPSPSPSLSPFLSTIFSIFHLPHLPLCKLRFYFILFCFFPPIILSSHNPHSSTSTGGAGAGAGGAGAGAGGSTFTATRGVHFTNPIAREGEETPHGMPCVREVLRFLIAIINPKDK